MALPDMERRASGWKFSKTVLHEDDALNILTEFAELKRKERQNDPKVKRVKNKYKLCGTRSPGTSQKDESLDQLQCFLDLDNLVPSGKQLSCTSLSAKAQQSHVLREIQANTKDVGSAQKLPRTAVSLKKEGDKTRPDTLKDLKNKNSMLETSAHKVMVLPDSERRASGWKCSKTVLPEEDALNLLTEFSELKRKECANDPKGKSVKNKCKPLSAYPSPGNILHTGRQLARSPGPGVLPLLPSQKFEPQVLGEESCEQLGSFPAEDLDNIVPSGRQLPRTPLTTNSDQCHVPRKIQPNTKDVKSKKRSQTVNNSVLCNTTVNLTQEGLNMADTLKDLENKNPVPELDAFKEATKELDVSRHLARNRRRISELPVQGLNQVRISGVLKKMPGYECRSEDLEFLTYMKTQEKAKSLKAELLILRKDLSATKQDKELVIAKKEKIEEDIEKMKVAYERTIQLGRAFLSRTKGPAAVQGLTPEDIVKQLNHMTIQNTHQQERAKLQTAQLEVTKRREEAARLTKHSAETKSLLISKMESYEKNVNKAKEKIKRLCDEVISLKTEIEKTEGKKCEIENCLQQKRQQINQISQKPLAPLPQAEISEEDREKMNRSLQRILHRKKLYIEREKILHKLKRDLK